MDTRINCKFFYRILDTYSNMECPHNRKIETRKIVGEVNLVTMFLRYNANRVPLTTNRRIFFTRVPFLSRNPVLPIGKFGEILQLSGTPIFYFSHILALFPFRQRNDKIELNFKSFIYGTILLAVSGVYSFGHMKNVYVTEETNIDILLYSSYALVNIIFVVACITMPILSRKPLMAILQGFSQVDAIVSRLQPDFEYRENLKRQNVQIYFTISVTLFLILAHLAALQEHIFPSFTYLEFYILPVTWFIIFQLDYFLLNLRKRFLFVNSQLENFVNEVSSHVNERNGAHIGSLNISLLNHLNYIHFTLYRISSEINNTYGVQLMIMIPRVIFFSVLPLHYNVVSALINDPTNSNNLNPYSHIFTLSFIILLTAPIFYVVSVASSTVNQAKTVYKYIHDLIDEDQEERIESELLIFSIQLMHRKVDFSVKNFFSLKPSLTTTVLELIITYVIIILQFQATLSSVSPFHLLLRPLQQSNSSYKLSSVTLFPGTLAKTAKYQGNIMTFFSNASYIPHTD